MTVYGKYKLISDKTQKENSSQAVNKKNSDNTVNATR
jgi:hypothetical protein